jgi:dTDP-4-amino-4,6-dideoxygalactose transaminase
MNGIRRVSVGDFRIGEEEKKAINEVLDIGRLSEGKKTHDFEAEFAKYIGTKYCVALSSGTGALIAGLMALLNDEKYKIRKNSKIITSPLTYISTVNAAVLTGFEPVFVDIDPVTFGMLPEKIEEHLAWVKDPENYSIILPVHLMGYMCDMESINRIAQKAGLIVLEDSAQAHGTVYGGNNKSLKGRKAGSFSALSIFSFYIAHNIQAGEMGAVVTNDKRIETLVKKIKANGRACDCGICTRYTGKCPRLPEGYEDVDPRFSHDIIAYNFKTMEFQAALGLSQLRKADWIFNQRSHNVKYLNERLGKFGDILKLPLFSENVSYLAYPVVIKDEKVVSRKKLRTELEKIGIETRPLFGCIPTQQPAYAYLKEKYEGKLPNAEYIGRNGFYIGCHQYLDDDALDYVYECFCKVLGKL